MSIIEKEIPIKSFIALVLAFGLVFGAMATAEAGKKKKKKMKRVERIVEIDYGNPGIGVAPVGGYPTGFPEAATEIPTGPDDLFFKVEVEDSSGQAVWGFLSQGDLDGNGVNDDGYGNFCGAHEETIPVAAPGTPFLGVYAYAGNCGPSFGMTPSVMTTGTIKVTFSNLP